MAANELGDVDESLRSLAEEAREAWGRFSEEIELDRRMRETPLTVLGVAALAGFVVGGGLWPALRPFVKVAARAALTPTNLLAIGAAVGAMKAASAREHEVPSATPAPGGGGATH